MIWLLLSAALAAPSGWRHDGSATFDVDAAPTAWSVDGPFAWKHPTASWGNASPVVAGGCVLITEEPAALMCLDVATGEERWRVRALVLDALSGEARTELEQRLSVADGEQAALDEARARFGVLQREARRNPGDVALGQELAETSTRMRDLKARLDGVRPYRTPADKDILGYATPTPVTDGTHVWALFGNGVVVCTTLAGTRVWTRWLGPPVEPMLGYHTGVASSPALSDGLLVVPYGTLQALDAATGTPRWAHTAPWKHYGAPAVGAVEGLGVVLTPGGELVRARDGEVMQTGLASIYYVGPVMMGPTAYVVGNLGDADRGAKDTGATAYDLKRQGDKVTATQRWHTALPSRDRFYVTPVQVGADLVVVDAEARLLVLDTASGAVRLDRSLKQALPMGQVMPTPTVADGHLYVTSYLGQTVLLEAGGDYTQVGGARLGEVRASPWFIDGAMFVRTLDAVVRVKTAE